MMKILDKIKKYITSTYTCIKYPYLYPRNRFTGLHYNNWNLHRYHVDNYLLAIKTLFTHIYTFDEWKERKEPILQRHYKSNNINLRFEIDDACVHVINNNKTLLMIPIQSMNSIYAIGFDYNKNINFYVVLKDESDISDRHLFINNIIVDKWLYFKIKVADFLNNYVLQIFHCLTKYTEWDALKCYPGWYKAFGKELLNEIDQQLRNDKIRYKWRITDIKEKWGSLQIYCNYGSRELYDIISKYEDISYHTCITCGKPAKYLSSGWICPYCEEHYNPEHGYTAIADDDGKWITKYDEGDTKQN